MDGKLGKEEENEEGTEMDTLKEGVKEEML